MSYSVWQSFITNGVKTISGAVVSVFHEGSGAPAALFSSPSGGSIGSSVTSDSSGLARFYVAAGVYRITVTHASFSAEHRHVRIGEMAGVDDAPSDGKQYARKDGDWEEVGGSFLGDVTKSVGTGGDFADLDELQTWMNANSGRFLTVNVLGEVASPSGALPALTNQTFLNVILNGVIGSTLNMTYFFGNVGLSGQFTLKGNLLFSSYVPSMYNVTVTLSKNSNEIVELTNCTAIGGIIIYDGELKVSSSTFNTLKAEKITLNNCDVFLCEAVTDTYLFLDLQGFNNVQAVDAKNFTIDYLMKKPRTSSTIGYVNNDTNVSSLLNGGAINVYNKDGYVVVGNK